MVVGDKSSVVKAHDASLPFGKQNAVLRPQKALQIAKVILLHGMKPLQQSESLTNF